MNNDEEYLDMVEFTNWGVDFNKRNRDKAIREKSAQELIDEVEKDGIQEQS